ncbi:hypothetical protein [uncultured Aquimarina sp.]|uniref:hypothetical protein n=1 Tax=uncultured Aquimarina sp. TaxID=575652 RepID=UPI00262E6DF4|nr:hypothetical protein [uncultured Aquimarina sp.]
MIKKNLLLFSILVSLYSYSQNIYEEKFEGCNTKRFALESEIETAKKDKNELIKLLTKHITNDAQQKLRGKLKLQIIVYMDGTSCLLSYENNTKLSSDELKIELIKELVDNELVWMNGKENIAALVELRFKRKEITLKRYGMNAKSGWHELKE